VKNILFIVLCTALLMSCASKRAAVVDSTITEAKVLQAVTKANGVEVPAADSLVTTAEKKKDEGQTEEAYFSADEAVLLYQISLLERENKNLTDSLRNATESLNIYRSLLEERRKAHR
jgi:hypothetical protein